MSRLWATLKSWWEWHKISWHCMLPTENGPFFINYVLTAATLGNALELTRIPELISYLICIILMSRSPAEYLRARQLTRFEFHFGSYYPRVLLVFTLVVTFSISNPLIAPVGMTCLSQHTLLWTLIHFLSTL